MKRIVFILDDLRRDIARNIIFPALKGAYFYEFQAFGDSTFQVFSKIAQYMRRFNGWKGLITGGGWIQKIDWSFLDFFWVAPSLFPLVNNLDLIRKFKLSWGLSLREPSLLIIHDCFIHNYFEDFNTKQRSEIIAAIKDDPENCFKAYENRCRQMIAPLQRSLELFSDWECFITTDHGEEFTGPEVTHDFGQYSKNVMDIFLISFRPIKFSHFKELFGEKECRTGEIV